MKRTVIAGLAFVVSTGAALCGDLQKGLEGRWRGAWTLSDVAIYSDCAGTHTNNRLNGTLVSSRGRYKFPAGELAQVTRVDLKRSRLDILLSLREPLLIGYQDGPFTLYREARCQAELQVELPRDLVKSENIQKIDAFLKPILLRHASESEAERQTSYNRRERDPYPPDYQRTLARHRAWKVRQANAAVQARLDKAIEETSRLADRIGGDPEYLRGFAAGVEEGRSVALGECGDMMAVDLAGPAQTLAAGMSEAQAKSARGKQDGRKLILGLGLVRGLPRCFAPVPEVPVE